MAGQSFRCFYINLDRSTDRRAEIEREIRGVGIEGERVPGFDGRRDLPAQATSYSAWRRALIGSQLNPAEIGCTESHRRALRKFVQSGEAFGVILEDDVQLLPGFRDAVEAVINDTAGWDAVRLEWRKLGVLADPAVATSLGHKLLVPKNMTFGGAAFLYSRRGAQLALKSLDKAFFQTPDAQIGSHCGLSFRLLQIAPAIAREKPLESLLGNKPEYVGGEDRESSRRNPAQALGNAIYRAWISVRRRWSAKPNALWVSRETARLKASNQAAPAIH